MNRLSQSGLLVLAFLVVGPVVVWMIPEYTEVDRDLLIQQFHLPADIEFAGLASRRGQRRTGPIEGIVQFTPEQYAAYSATLDDPSVWRPTPFERRGIMVEGVAEPNALRWWPNSEAIITGDMALFWVNWGHIHGKPPDGGSRVWDARSRRTFCFAVQSEAFGGRIRPCNSLPANGSKETLFKPGEAPVTYVRGLLDQDRQRLFMYIR